MYKIISIHEQASSQPYVMLDIKPRTESGYIPIGQGVSVLWLEHCKEENVKELLQQINSL